MDSASFSTALAAAQLAAGSQHYPQGAVYMVATPIGNLADISLRALHVLGLVDLVACEDTRHTQQLLRAYGIDKPLLALHEHNEEQASETVIAQLAQGRRVAYVSDAGTPAISDPGARLARAACARGHGVVPIPGASSVTTALSAAGLAGDGHFVFAGFLSSKAMERDAAVAALALEARSVVLLEAPHRILALAHSLAALGSRGVTVARELTKQFEQVATMPAERLVQWLEEDAHHQRGEFVLVLHPHPPRADDAGLRVLQLLLAELPLKTAVKLASEITGEARNGLYSAALALRDKDGGP
jgi:16S rRNA (cytidine1402-2'-O)-methyltransferase